MKIVIPSYNRYEKPLKTVQSIPQELYKNVAVYVRKEQYENYRNIVPDNIEVISLENVFDIVSTRNAMLEKSHDDIIMLDDDLDFKVLIDGKFKTPTDEQSLKMFKKLFKLMQHGFAHVSVACASVALNAKGKLLHNVRYFAVLGFKAGLIKKLGVKFRVRFIDDFDFALQLIRRGYPSAVLSDYIIQTKLNAKGGLSTIRTSKGHKKSALTLQKVHAPFVKVVKSHDWEGMTDRVDVRVQWKKAFESAKIKNIPKGYNI